MWFSARCFSCLVRFRFRFLVAVLLMYLLFFCMWDLIVPTSGCIGIFFFFRSVSYSFFFIIIFFFCSTMPCSQPLVDIKKFDFHVLFFQFFVVFPLNLYVVEVSSNRRRGRLMMIHIYIYHVASHFCDSAVMLRRVALHGGVVVLVHVVYAQPRPAGRVTTAAAQSDHSWNGKRCAVGMLSARVC